MVGRLCHDSVRMVGTAVPVSAEVEQSSEALSVTLQATPSSGQHQEDLSGRPAPQSRAQPKRTVPSQALSLQSKSIQSQVLTTALTIRQLKGYFVFHPTFQSNGETSSLNVWLSLRVIVGVVDRCMDDRSDS